MDKMLIWLIALVLSLAFLIFIFIKRPTKNRLTRLLRFIVIVALIIAIVIIAVREYGPNGANPIFSEAGRGENEGTDSKESSSGYEEEGGTSEIIVITVRGTSVIIGENTYECEGGAFTELDEYLKSCDYGGNEVVIQDDYAASSTVHHVCDSLDEAGVVYRISTGGNE